MAELIQCENCGALLAEEDIFCGECGAPRPSAAEAVEPAVPEPLPYAPPTPPPVPPAPLRPPEPPETGWRVAFITLVVLGLIACCVGLLVFLFFGMSDSGNYSPEENWVFSAICCLLPIGGTGALLALAGAGVWYTRLRNR